MTQNFVLFVPKLEVFTIFIACRPPQKSDLHYSVGPFQYLAMDNDMQYVIEVC